MNRNHRAKEALEKVSSAKLQGSAKNLTSEPESVRRGLKFEAWPPPRWRALARRGSLRVGSYSLWAHS